MVRDNIGMGSSDPTVGSVVKWVVMGVFALIVFIALLSIPYTIDAGERGVVLTWGSPSMEAKGPGLHGKIPFAQHVVKMVVQTQKYDADATAASKDMQIVHANIAVNYHILPETVPTLYKDIGVGYEAKIYSQQFKK